MVCDVSFYSVLPKKSVGSVKLGRCLKNVRMCVQ